MPCDLKKKKKNLKNSYFLYTEILAEKVVLCSDVFSRVKRLREKKIHNSTFQVKISVIRTQFFQMRWNQNMTSTFPKNLEKRGNQT